MQFSGFCKKKNVNNFWLDDATEKLRVYLESWNIEDFKNVHHFTVALSDQQLFCWKS